MGLDPATLAIAAFASSAIGTGISAIGAISSANAQAANANYQAQVARNNQIIANQNAAYAAQAGAASVTRSQLQQRSATAGVGAALAANGLDINTGSPAQVRAGESEITQLNTENTAQQAALNVYGFRTQATNYGAQSNLFGQEASQASTAGLLSAGGILFNGAGSLASKWAGWQNQTSTGGLF